ncbi:MAG TPA: universal stress protein [Bacteroidia bacterium]|nr:universal stress protein [Bacteroidia bacterium]
MITIQTNKILIPIDFSLTSTRAIKHGASIARLTKGELILLHVQKKTDLVDIILPAYRLNSTTILTDYLEKKLEKLAVIIRKQYEIAVTCLVSMGNITSEIVNIAEEYKVGMIIMGTQGKDSTNDLFLGSNSYRVITKSTVPIMTIRSEVPKMGYSNILLPIDSSVHSRQKVNSAIKIANTFAAHLHVLGLLGKHEDNYEYKLKVILPQIQKMAHAEKLVCKAEIEKASNRAEKTLAYAKKIKADMIIIMSDEKTELSGLILGTYAHQLINNASIPVLCIPPEIHPENMEMDSIGGMW